MAKGDSQPAYAGSTPYQRPQSGMGMGANKFSPTGFNRMGGMGGGMTNSPLGMPGNGGSGVGPSNSGNLIAQILQQRYGGGSPTDPSMAMGGNVAPPSIGAPGAGNSLGANMGIAPPQSPMMQQAPSQFAQLPGTGQPVVPSKFNNWAPGPSDGIMRSTEPVTPPGSMPMQPWTDGTIGPSDPNQIIRMLLGGYNFNDPNRPMMAVGNPNGPTGLGGQSLINGKWQGPQ